MLPYTAINDFNPDYFPHTLRELPNSLKYMHIDLQGAHQRAKNCLKAFTIKGQAFSSQRSPGFQRLAEEKDSWMGKQLDHRMVTPRTSISFFLSTTPSAY